MEKEEEEGEEELLWKEHCVSVYNRHSISGLSVWPLLFGLSCIVIAQRVNEAISFRPEEGVEGAEEPCHCVQQKTWIAS